MVGGRLLALLAVAAASAGAAGAVGNATSQPGPRFARIPALPTIAGVGSRCPIPAPFRPAFEFAARDTGLPLALLVAVGEIESDFRAEAVSEAGARGLLQLMPGTAAELELDPDHPPSNVLAGARYLRLLLDRFQSADLALAAYNAGPTVVERIGGAPTMATLTYVANVTARWRKLVGCR